MALTTSRDFLVTQTYACDGTSESRIYFAPTPAKAISMARQDDRDNGVGMIYGKITYRARLAAGSPLSFAGNPADALTETYGL